jgi:hypothetical protein
MMEELLSSHPYSHSSPIHTTNLIEFQPMMSAAKTDTRVVLIISSKGSTSLESLGAYDWPKTIRVLEFGLIIPLA